jgi:long-chain acyl-CoA synthetase
MSISGEQIAKARTYLTSPGQFFEVELRNGEKVFKNAKRDMVELVNAARVHGDKPFLVYEGRRLTFAETFAQTDALAAALQQDFGVKQGDRVAIAMRNTPEWVIGYYAATLAGAIATPINSWGKAEDLEFCLKDSGAKLLIADQARFDLIRSELWRLNLDVLVCGAQTAPELDKVQRIEDVIAARMGQQPDTPSVDPDENCIILYTSGSTGFPKGVPQRHIALTQALFNQLFSGGINAALSGPSQAPATPQPQESHLLSVPLFHATGLMAGVLMPALMGHKVVMLYKWDVVRALELIQSEGITNFSSVPAILKEFVSHPDLPEYDVSSLKRVGAGGAATPAGLPELIQEKLGAHLGRGQGWGMTETLAVGSTLGGPLYAQQPLSCGIVSPIIELRFGDVTGAPLPPGQSGEIQVRGVAITRGYWQKPEANADVFTPDGFLRSGDVGHLDPDGFLFITGRIKEIVIRGGENISPAEIEQGAYRVDAVQEVVVFGVEDEALGEELAMVCYLHPTKSITEADLRTAMLGLMAAYKVPKHIAFSKEPLPRNASEKLHKRAVKERYLQGSYRGD